MSLTGLPLLLLSAVVIVLVTAATIRLWRRRLPAVRVAGVLLIEALAVFTAGLALNIGGEVPYTLLALAQALVRANGGGRFEHREFPEERKKIDIGDFVTDDRRFRELTGWAPRTGLDHGLRRSLEYYRRHRESYV